MGLFNLIARLSLNASGYEAGLKRAESASTRFANRAGSAIKGQLAAAFGTAAIIAATKETVKYGAKIQDTANRIGLSAERVQELTYALEQNGATVEDLSRAFAQLGRARLMALSGAAQGQENNRAAGAFKALLGVTPEELQRMNIDELFSKIASAVSSGRLANRDRGAILQVLFGESGEKLIPVFLSGIDEMATAVREIGGVIDNDLVAALKRADDEIVNLKMSFRGFIAEVAPFIEAGIRSATIGVALARKIASNKRAGLVGATVGVVADEYNKAFKTIVSGPLAKIVGGAITGNRQIADVSEFFAADDKIKEPKYATSRLGLGSLASIGGFIGAGGTRNATIAVLQEIKQNTKATADALRTKEEVF